VKDHPLKGRGQHHVAHFRQPFAKLFALYYRTIVCLSEVLVYCGQTIGWIRMPLFIEVVLSPGHIVLPGDPAPPRGAQQLPHFSAHVYCDQMTGWVRIPLGMEVGLGPGYIVLPGDPATPELHSGSHTFQPMSTMAK